MRRWYGRGPGIAFALVVCLGASLQAADRAAARWPQFHGPEGAGVAEGTPRIPVEFGVDKALLWQAELPTGHSSPVIWGDRIFLTGFEPADKRLETLALDRKSGRILWRRSVPAAAIEPVHAVGSPAAPTPVTDGRSVFVYFGSYGLVAYDLDGKERWSRAQPKVKTLYKPGTGSSPVLSGDRLVVDVPLEKDSYLLAVGTKDGEVLWKAAKPEFHGGWATPVTWREDGDAMVGIQSPSRFSAHRMRDGSEKWWVADLPRQACATPAVGDGVLFLSASGMQGEADNITLPPSFDDMLARHDADHNGRLELVEVPETLLLTDRRASRGAGDMTVRQLLKFVGGDKGPPDAYDREQWEAVVKMAADFVNGPMMKAGILAVRMGGSGDVTRSHVVWSDSRGVGEVPSPLLYQGRVYSVKNGGIVLSRDAGSGKTMMQARLGAAGGYYASPVAAGGRIYVASDEGTVVVFEAADTLRVLARNALPEPIMATPAIADGALYVRTLNRLYAFGGPAKTSP
jgi:outer membrane protein assembly factor BamB